MFFGVLDLLDVLTPARSIVDVTLDKNHCLNGSGSCAVRVVLHFVAAIEERVTLLPGVRDAPRIPEVDVGVDNGEAWHGDFSVKGGGRGAQGELRRAAA